MAGILFLSSLATLTFEAIAPLYLEPAHVIPAAQACSFCREHAQPNRVPYAENTPITWEQSTQALEIPPHQVPVVRQNPGAEEQSEKRSGLPCSRSPLSDPEHSLPPAPSA